MEFNDATANKLTQVITTVISTGRGIIDLEIAEKLLCFDTNKVTTFQSLKTGVTAQIKEKYAPFATSIHYCAHWLNLAVQSLSSMTVMHSIEEVLCMNHSYFAHSPKKVVEFKALAQQLESKGLKLLKNVKTRWISCLGPIHRLLRKTRVLLQ